LEKKKEEKDSNLCT